MADSAGVAVEEEEEDSSSGFEHTCMRGYAVSLHHSKQHRSFAQSNPPECWPLGVAVADAEVDAGVDEEAAGDHTRIYPDEVRRKG